MTSKKGASTNLRARASQFCCIPKLFKRATPSTTAPDKPKDPDASETTSDSSSSLFEVPIEPGSSAARLKGPIIIQTASHDANPIFPVPKPLNKVTALPLTCEHECKEVIQCSIDFAQPPTDRITRCDNGFVDAVTRAYSAHHRLELRPEDVWFAILTQFSAYVNAHAEELRGQFVAHEGKKELRLVYDAPGRFAFDFGVFARDMSRLLEANVVDPELREWIIPAFSTTTREDTVAASIVMMASLQKYFTYVCEICCGIPSVTLRGDRADWAAILQRLAKLRTFGKEPAQFCSLLVPILRRIVRTFDQPDSPETVDFWQRMVHRHPGGSGEDFYSGWITAFCFWTDEGKSFYRQSVPYSADPKHKLELDGVAYGTVKVGRVPPGWAKVPVTVIDHGEELECMMVAGSVAVEYAVGAERREGDGEEGVVVDTMVPRVGWWMYEKKEGVDGSQRPLQGDEGLEY